jgi:hypothetical protein
VDDFCGKRIPICDVGWHCSMSANCPASDDGGDGGAVDINVGRTYALFLLPVVLRMVLGIMPVFILLYKHAKLSQGNGCIEDIAFFSAFTLADT